MTDVGRKQNVVVTAFGPFREHKTNPSWEAIRDDQLKIDRPNVCLILKQIKVTYEEVDEIVEQLWLEYDPILMVHIGLAASATEIRLEEVARHGPYVHDDLIQQAPHKHLRQYDESSQCLEEQIKKHKYSIKPCEFASSRTSFDIPRICHELERLHEQGLAPLSFKCSNDAGLYVCEYMYQKSLRICDRTVFIHVPDIEKFRLEDIRKSLQIAIELLIDKSNEIPS